MMILTLGPGDLSAKIKIATLIIYSRRLLNGRARCLGNRKKEMKTKKKGKKKETTTTIQRAPLWTRDPPIFFSVRRRRPIIFPPDGQSQPPTREACLAIWIIPMRVQVEEEEKSDISPLLLADNEDSDNDSHWLVNCHSISSSDWKTFTSRQWKAPAKSSFSPAFTRIVFFPSSFLLQDFLCLWTMIVWIYRLLRHDNPSRIPVFSLFYFPTGSIWKEVRSILFSDFNPVRSMNSPEFGHIGIRFFSFFLYHTRRVSDDHLTCPSSILWWEESGVEAKLPGMTIVSPESSTWWLAWTRTSGRRTTLYWVPSRPPLPPRPPDGS